MSETVSNAEIEDVLSSIRRLVSENARPGRSREKAGEEGPGRLVLTPDFRVPERAAEVEDHATETDVAQEGDDASADDASEDDAQGWSGETPDEAQVHEEEWQAAEEPVPEAEHHDDNESDPEEGGEEPETAHEHFKWSENGDQEAEAQTDTAPEEDPADQAEDTAGWAAQDEAQGDAEPQDEEEHDAGFEEGHLDALSLEERVAELEAAIGESTEDWEPDGSEERDMSPPRVAIFEHYARAHSGADAAPEPETASEPAPEPEVEEAQPWVDADEPQEAWSEPPAEFEETAAEEEAHPTGAEEGAESGMFDGPDEDMVIDEDALRDLVQRLVREELQGEVGERITRNVRRLVRREIQRALALRDFE